jgi:hypothetical protein
MTQEGTLEQAVSSVTLVNATAKTIDTPIPTGERWLLLSIKLTNPDDVQRFVTASIYKEAAKTNIVTAVQSYTVAAAATGVFPSTTASVGYQGSSGSGVLLKAGNVLSVIWSSGGASAGGTDADGLVITYLRFASRG